MQERATYDGSDVSVMPDKRGTQDDDVNDNRFEHEDDQLDLDNYESNTKGEREQGLDDDDATDEYDDEAGLDDDHQEQTTFDPNEAGIGEPDGDKGSAYPDHQRQLEEFLEGKSLAYIEEKDPNGNIEQISMSYQGRENEPGLADITESMRDKLGYAEGRNDPDALDKHVDAILETVLGNEHRNDSCFSRHDRALADMCRTEENSTRTPGQMQEQLAYALAFEQQSKANYEQLRNDVKNELLNGQPSAEASFMKYQDDVNNGAKNAAESYAKAEDHYQILGIDPDATDSEVRRAYGAAAKKYHSDQHPYPEYETYMKEVNAAYDTLSNPDKRSNYDQRLENNAQAHEEWRQAHPENDEAYNGDDTGFGDNTGFGNGAGFGDNTGFGDDNGNENDNGFGDDNGNVTRFGEDTGNGNGNGARSDTTIASYHTPDPQEAGTQGPNEETGKEPSTDWSPEKVANWHEENEEKGISWIEAILLAMAAMIANATDKASGGNISADGINRSISNYMATPQGPSVQEQHNETVADLGKIDEDITTRYAVKDEDQAQALRDLTLRASEHLHEYGMYDDKGNQQRNGGEPYYEVIGLDDDGEQAIQKTHYEPIKGLEWDNSDRTLDATMQDSMTGTDDVSIANRQHLSDMLKERVDWIQQSDSYVDFNDPDKAAFAQELLDKYNENQVNLDERKAAIDPAMLWNAENNLGGMTIYLDKSIQEQRELTQQEIQAIADTIRHCDYLVNATGTPKQERSRS